MSQDTAFGEATVTTYMKVEKGNGTVKYYKVVGDETQEIDEMTYYREGGQ